MNVKEQNERLIEDLGIKNLKPGEKVQVAVIGLDRSKTADHYFPSLPADIRDKIVVVDVSDLQGKDLAKEMDFEMSVQEAQSKVYKFYNLRWQLR